MAGLSAAADHAVTVLDKEKKKEQDPSMSCTQNLNDPTGNESIDSSACCCDRCPTTKDSTPAEPVAASSPTERPLTSTLEFVSISTMTRPAAKSSNTTNTVERNVPIEGSQSRTTRALCLTAGLLVGAFIGLIAIATATTGSNGEQFSSLTNEQSLTMNKAVPNNSGDESTPGFIVQLPDVNDDNAILFPSIDPDIYVDTIPGLDENPQFTPVSR